VIAAKSESESGVLFCVKTAVAQRTRAESRFKKVRIFSPTIMFLLSQQSDSRLHRLRKTAATRWSHNGISVRTIQAWLGHKSLETTMLYLGVQDSNKLQTNVNAAFGDQLHTARQVSTGILQRVPVFICAAGPHTASYFDDGCAEHAVVRCQS
jgi:site-specific recombinase XerC